MCLDEPNESLGSSRPTKHKTGRVGVHPERNCVSCVCAGVCAVCVCVCTYSVHVFLHISYEVIAEPAPGTGILVTG